jgi:hypothetical protein
MKFNEQPNDPGAHFGVNVAGRLVSDQERGFANHGPSDSHALLFPTG